MARVHLNLPPLKALDAFEAAARHRSFKRAAAELNVSPSAISHQVKALERDVGVPLFLRNNRGVDLNEDGHALYAALESCFRQMSQAVGLLRRRATRSDVTVMATTAMSHLWLTPRLAKFWREHGAITVNQQVVDTPLSEAPFDLLLRYGDIASDEGECEVLFEDHLRPVASPEFADGHRVETLEDLVQLPLIHLNAPDKQWTSWKEWLSIMGYKGPVPDGLTVNNYIIALQAAQDGMGVVLGWERMTAPLFQTAALQRFTRFRSPAPNLFYIRKSTGAGEDAETLRNWLLEAARGEDASH